MKISMLITMFILYSTCLNSFKLLNSNTPLEALYNTNFLEKKKLTNTSEKIKNNQFIYDTQIAIIKETDQIEDKPIKFDVKLELSQDSINIYEKNIIKNRISYLE
jgi:hypothetical protein